jgi:hypothetical protein
LSTSPIICISNSFPGERANVEIPHFEHLCQEQTTESLGELGLLSVVAFLGKIMLTTLLEIQMQDGELQ